MLHIQMHHQRDAKKRIFLCILGIHTLCLTLSDFSSGLTVYWTRASESGIKWAVVIEAGVGAGRQCPGWAGGCVWPWWGSSLPGRPGLPCGEPGGGWWRSRHFPPAEKAPPAPACREREREPSSYCCWHLNAGRVNTNTVVFNRALCMKQK